jgi:hypothetical protein
MRESTLERRGEQLLVEHGLASIKLGKNGWPDRMVFCGPCAHEFVEWKRPGGRLTAAQKRRVPKLRARGEVVYVIDNLAAFERLIHHWERTYAREVADVPAPAGDGVGDPVP